MEYRLSLHDECAHRERSARPSTLSRRTALLHLGCGFITARMLDHRMISKDTGRLDTTPPDVLGATAVVTRGVVSRLFHVMARCEVTGLENVPSTGACLIIFNQLSFFDTALVPTIIPRPDLTGPVARSYRRNRFFRFLVEAGGGAWIHLPAIGPSIMPRLPRPRLQSGRNHHWRPIEGRIQAPLPSNHVY